MPETYVNQSNEKPAVVPPAATVHPEQGVATQTGVVKPQGIETIPAEPESYKGTNAAGLQSIVQAINILKTHSAANVHGSIIGEAITLLDQGYGVLVANKV